MASEAAAGGAGAAAAEPEAAAQPTVPVAPSGAEGAVELAPEGAATPEGAAGDAGAATVEPEAAAQPAAPVAPSGVEGAAELAPEGTAEAAAGAAAEAVEGAASAGRGAVGAVGGIARALIPGGQREGEPVGETAPPAEPRVPVDGAAPVAATGETVVSTPTVAVTSPSAPTRAAEAVAATIPMTTPPVVAAVTAPVAPVVVPVPGAPEVPQGRALRRALRRQRRAGQVQAAERWRGREIVGLRVEAADPDDRVLPGATVTVNPDRSGDTAIRKRAEEDGAVEVLAPAGPVTIAVSSPGYLPMVTRTVLTRSERIRLHLLPLLAATAPVLDQMAPRIREKQVSGYVSLLVTDVTTAAPVSDASGFVAGVTRETADTNGVIHYELPLGTWRIAVVADGYIPSVTTIVVGSPGEHAASVGIVPVPKEGEIVVRGQQVLFGDPVQFRTDSAEIDPESARLLDRLADKLHQLPETLRIVVRGHTDDRGSTAMNLELSRARAEAVAQALIARGIDPDRIRVEAYGDTEPLVPRSDPKSRSLNRRVEIALEAPAEQEDATVELDEDLLADEFAEPETTAPEPATTGASPVTPSSEYQDLIQDLLGIDQTESLR
ncbi:MAG: OmpA family protein [Candidatus Dadabacteria bacterium]|nr:MAG: OmpA family protein [Candidatus Dadabacteria bacterium]